MSKKLGPDHGVDAHKDKMGKVMHEFKRGQLHSGTGKKGKKGKVVTKRDQAIAIERQRRDRTPVDPGEFLEDADAVDAEVGDVALRSDLKARREVGHRVEIALGRRAHVHPDSVTAR